MTGAAASSDYYQKRAEEARVKAASAIHEAVREEYLALARIYQLHARRAAESHAAA
jgi:hypothetical protein